MSDQTNSLHFPDSLEDRIGILIEELDLAIRWKRPAILMVAYGSEYVRADSVSLIENFLIDREQKIVRIHAGEAIVNSLGFWESILEGSDQAVFFMDGFSYLVEQHQFVAILEQHGYLFADKCARIIFWLTYREASTLANSAPSFWVRRCRLIDLMTTPKPEQILQRALEAAWQGIGEYDNRYDDTEARITLRESFLTELPHNTESTSMRAQLMLTLGILHWRKGDHEKANEAVQSALRMAARIQDTWFEAECFNAVALIKSSLGRNEEAIDAYKQAIKLSPDQIFAWNNLGNLCLKIDRNHEAMIAFQKAIEHNPTDAIAWNGMGDVYGRSDYLDDAIAAYRKSIELASLLPHPWNGLGEIYERSGRPNDAVQAFENAIKLNSRFIRPWLGLAKLYAVQERYRDAARAYQQALMIDPQNSIIWNDLGCVYRDAGRYDDAAEALEKAIEIDHGFGLAYSNLALVHANNRKPTESISLYLKGLELLHEPELKHETWNRLANSYRMVNDYENAIRAYQMADSLGTPPARLSQFASNDPEPVPVSEAESAPDSYIVRAVDRSEEKPVERESIQSEINEAPSYWIFESAMQPEPTPASLFQPATFSSGPGARNEGEHNRSVKQEIGGTSMQLTLPWPSGIFPAGPTFTGSQDLSKSDSSDVASTTARVWNEKGNTLFRAGAYEDAIRAYNEAIKLDRSFGWPYSNLGTAYLHLGRYAEAILLLQKSLELLATARDQAVAWNELGNLYRCLNDYDNAVIAYQKADELDQDHSRTSDAVKYLHSEPNSSNAHVWNELGNMFFKGGSYNEASNCYRKVVEMEPFNGRAYSNLALSLTYQSRFDDCVSLYLKSIELFEDDKEKADAWNKLGNVYRRLNDYDQAINAYKNAVDLNNEKTTLLSRARFSLLGNCSVD